MNRKGRLALINSVITSTATFFLTVFPAEKWMIKRFDKLRRTFLWAPDDEANGGKCLVSWRQISAPTAYGGLGIKDLEAFSRALRLRWEWFRWDEKDRPWKGMATPCGQADKDLFAACTTITIGNGETAKFWADSWLNGQAPMKMAPLLFKLAARKNLSVSEALLNGRWMKGLQKITTEAQLDELVDLWTCLQSVSLSDGMDSISWNITADGNYSAVSAYNVQFHGRIRQPHLEQVWRIKCEGKVRFFFWLMLQNRNWTAERLHARGLPHYPVCCLCDQEFETAAHLALLCPFAKEVWAKFETQYPQAARLAFASTTVNGWWTKARRGRHIEQKKKEISVAIYIFWHIWKERGSRIFEGLSATPDAVASRVNADLQLCNLAWAR